MRASYLVVAAMLSFAAAPAALAAGSGSTDPVQTPTCPKGEVYSPTKKACVPKTSEIIPDRSLLDQAWALAKVKGDFAAARDLFELAADRTNPEVLNGLGYTNRKLGLFEAGIGYYKQALAIDPNYVQVREYLGEGYVTMGKFDLAREQLAEIANRCGTSCEEYADLSEAIDTGVKQAAAGASVPAAQ